MFQQLRQKARESTTTPNTLPVRPIATSPASPDVGEVVLGFDIADWATFVFVGGISFPIGYAIGKPIRTPAMFTMGFLGSVAGFLLAYQNSSGELKQITIWEDVRKKKVIEIKRSVISSPLCIVTQVSSSIILYDPSIFFTNITNIFKSYLLIFLL